MILIALALTALSAVSVVSAQSAGASLQTCLAAAADYSPVYATAVFPATSPEIDAVFRFADGEHHAKLTAKWIAATNSLAGTNTLTLARNTAAGVLRLELRRGFPAGQYRLEVSADGRPWRSVAFQVVPASGGGLASLAGLMPLAPGTVWTYSFVQTAGGIARISAAPPGATLGADGTVRATVTATIAGSDAQGVRVAWARGGVPFTDEWWRVTPGGLAAVKRAAGGETLVLDPPQVLFPWPVATARHWQYVSRDRTLRQSYRLWGPVPVTGPSGAAPGYVILVEQKGPMATTTVERDYLPGVGMVRSLAITGIGAERANREELVLTGVR